MKNAMPEKDPILARIERLEQQNRRLKRGALACFIVFVSAGLMAQTQTTHKPKPKPAPAPPAPPAVPKSLEAESFILKDSNGKERAELSMGGTGPNLKLLDQNGSALVTLSLNDSAPAGPIVLLSDAQHHAGISVSVLENAGPQLSLNGEPTGSQVHLAAAPDGTTLDVSDPDGFATSIGTGTHQTKTGQVKKTNAASITLFNKDRKVLWSAP